MASREHFSLRGLYLYSVCLITLLVTLFAVVQIVRSSVELAYPDPYAAPAAFPEAVCPDGVVGAECDRLTLSAEKESERAADSQRRWSVLSLVGAVTTALFAAPVYVYHWRRIQRDRAEESGG